MATAAPPASFAVTQDISGPWVGTACPLRDSALGAPSMATQGGALLRVGRALINSHLLGCPCREPHSPLCLLESFHPVQRPQVLDTNTQAAAELPLPSCPRPARWALLRGGGLRRRVGGPGPGGQWRLFWAESQSAPLTALACWWEAAGQGRALPSSTYGQPEAGLIQDPHVHHEARPPGWPLPSAMTDHRHT